MKFRKDRRDAKRMEYICEIECEGMGISKLNTRITDLSVTGVFIDSMTSFPAGSLLKLRFWLRSTEINVVGEVRYSLPQTGMGVRFVDIGPRELKAIEGFIQGVSEESNPASERRNAPIQAGGGLDADEALAGRFLAASLFDIIQMIEGSRLTGALAIDSPTAEGEIHFNEGQIVGATTAVRDGLPALVDFFGAADGTFEFKKSDQPYPRSIEAPNNAALVIDLLHSRNERPDVRH